MNHKMVCWINDRYIAIFEYLLKKFFLVIIWKSKIRMLEYGSRLWLCTKVKNNSNDENLIFCKKNVFKSRGVWAHMARPKSWTLFPAPVRKHFWEDFQVCRRKKIKTFYFFLKSAIISWVSRRDKEIYYYDLWHSDSRCFKPHLVKTPFFFLATTSMEPLGVFIPCSNIYLTNFLKAAITPLVDSRPDDERFPVTSLLTNSTTVGNVIVLSLVN